MSSKPLKGVITMPQKHLNYQMKASSMLVFAPFYTCIEAYNVQSCNRRYSKRNRSTITIPQNILIHI